MGRVNESVDVTYLPASERDAQVALLDDAWIGDEGPMDASFRQGFESRALMPRGLAFDTQTTVLWDEDAVQVARAEPPEPGAIALRSSVILRDGFVGPPKLERTDYLRAGTLIASRYSFDRSMEGADDA